MSVVRLVEVTETDVVFAYIILLMAALLVVQDVARLLRGGYVGAWTVVFYGLLGSAVALALQTLGIAGA